jgi:hypothetical protein
MCYFELQKDNRNNIYAFIPNLTAQDNTYSDIQECDKNYYNKNIKTFEKEGYTLLHFDGGFYKNQYTRIEYVCGGGHKNTTTWNSFKEGCRCPDCVRESYKNIVKAFSSEGYKVLTTNDEYTNHEVKFRFICPNGHTSSMIWQSFKSGCRCGLCAANRKKTIEDVRKEFLDRGFILTSKEYINSTSNLDFICDKGHNHSITYTNFHSGQGCGVCSPTKEKTNTNTTKKDSNLK